MYGTKSVIFHTFMAITELIVSLKRTCWVAVGSLMHGMCGVTTAVWEIRIHSVQIV